MFKMLLGVIIPFLGTSLGAFLVFFLKDKFNKKLHKITIDHTLVNLLVKSGELTEEEAKNHPKKNVLMKALGSSTNIEMDIFNVELGVDGIFLCSDGLTNMLSDAQIVKVLNDNTSIKEKLEKLVFKANNRGGNDNISIAYLIKEDNNDK